MTSPQPAPRVQAGSDARMKTFGVFIELEKRIRHAVDEDVFGFLAVNETLNLLPYRQAILWRAKDDGSPGGRIVAVSGLAVPDPTAPFIRLTSRLCAHCANASKELLPRVLATASLPEDLRAGWREWLPSELIWLPLSGAQGQFLGALLLAREEPWKDAERHILGYLADSYGHAWSSLRATRRRLWSGWRRPRRLKLGIAAAVLVLCGLPIRQSALAPAEIVAFQPAMVGAPVDGVVDRFEVQPNQLVEEGQVLLRLDATRLKSRLEVARKSLEIAAAEYRQVSQQAVTNDPSRAETTILRSKMEQAEAEVDYVQELLERIIVRAPRSGLAIFDDVNQWLGRPVTTGERILQIADAELVELEIRLPVADAIALQDGAEVRLFLNIDPQRPVSGSLRYASYEASVTPEGHYAYRLLAELNDDARPLRIGLKGTAKVYGEKTLLIVHILRRPIVTLRQYFGL